MLRGVILLLVLAIAAPAFGQSNVLLNYRNGTNTVQVQPTAPLPVTNTPAGTQNVTLVPTSSSSAGITSVVSSSAESNHVLKAGAGNLYSVYVTAGATAGFLMVFNATSAPVDGAVTPVHCVVVPANQSVSLSFGDIPNVFSTGITAVFSSTGCFTQTASATAFFSGRVQ